MDIDESHLLFIRNHLIYMLDRMHVEDELRVVFINKEKNQNKSIRPVTLSVDLERKKKTVTRCIDSGLATLTPDEIQEFCSYLDDLDPIDEEEMGSSDALMPPPQLTSSHSAHASSTSTASASTRPVTAASRDPFR